MILLTIFMVIIDNLWQGTQPTTVVVIKFWPLLIKPDIEEAGGADFLLIEFYIVECLMRCVMGCDHEEMVTGISSS